MHLNTESLRLTETDFNLVELEFLKNLTFFKVSSPLTPYLHPMP